MTTLVLTESRSVASTGSSPTVSLREWLGEHWVILFSHPEDFDQEQLERDRWLCVLRRSFSVHGIRPLALARYGSDGRQAAPYGWLAELGDGISVALSTTPSAHDALLDFHASALRAEIACSGPRFVMIIDPDLRCQRTVHYRTPIDLPSPIELIGWTVALRDRHQPEAASRAKAVTALQARNCCRSRRRLASASRRA